MKEEIRDIHDMTDSREMMESKTHPFIPIFITLLFVLIFSALIWSFFGEMDSVAKANAVVRPNEKVSTVQASVLGKANEIFFQEGMQVQAGDLLLTLDHPELITEKDHRVSELQEVQIELEYLHKYKESVDGLENLFSTGTSEERFYYDLAAQFLLDYNQRKVDFQSSKLQVEQTKNEINQSKETIQMNLRLNEQKLQQNEMIMKDQTLLLSTALESEELQLLSIEDDNKEYVYYQTQLEQLVSKEDEALKKYERSKELGERFVTKVQIEDEKKIYESAQQQTIAYKNEILLNVENKIQELEIHTQDLSGSSESLQLQNKQLISQQKELRKQEELVGQSETIALQKFKIDKVVQINMTIEEKENRRDALNENIEQINFAIDQRNIRAPISGTVNVQKDMNVGDFVQSGETLFSIIPTNESKYKMSIAVPNHEVGKIKVGDKVDLNFNAFPKQSYGSLAGTVSSIGSDSTVQQDGSSYYMVEAAIANEPLINRKNEQAEIRVGMTAEAYVITESPKIIYYVLEKINLRD